MPSTLESRFPEIIASLRPRVSAAVKSGAQQIAKVAAEKAPYDENSEGPHLRDAIHVEREGVAEYAVVAGDSEVFWGHFVENGTSHSAPEPFLVPAAEEEKEAVVLEVEIVLREL